MQLRFNTYELETADLHVAQAGDESNPLIICLHGFPEFWEAWGPVMQELANEFHLAAPDQRGFNLSSKPDAVEAYRTKHMVADLDSLAARLSPDKPFILAGHDWGASVAYAYAIAHPQRVSKLIIANGVHPVCFQRAIMEDAEQRAASQYINRLRAQDAEELLSGDEYRRLLRMIAGFSKADFMNDEMKARYIQAWSQPGALTGMLNWYRASPIVVPQIDGQHENPMILEMPEDKFSVQMPHLVIWGEEDDALRPSCLDGLERFAPELRIVRVQNAGHWILHEKPHEVAQAMRSFIMG